MNPKFFTIDDANAMIGFLESAFERIRRNRQRFLWLQEEISILTLIVECGSDDRNPDARELEEKTKQLAIVDREIARAKAAITETGCIIKDEDSGMVDFFSIQNNTVVYLSWKKGEDAIGYWRSIRDTSGDRRPLERSPSA
jgi:hypothetical protein